VRKGLLAVVFAGLSALAVTPAAAQNTSAQEFDLNAAAIYDFVLNEWNASSNLGAHFDVAKRFLSGDGLHLYALGEVGFNHFEFVTVSSYAGGLRIASAGRQKQLLFGQVLAGAEHASSNTSFMLQPGGGVDFSWKPQFAVRVQVDWRHIFSDFDDQDGLRVGVGLVFPLNR